MTLTRSGNNGFMHAAAATIIHADMDAFYAAVEQHDRSELRGKPVIVGGRNARGVVLTASYEARVYGVHSAMPAIQARRLCPHGLFVSPRMARYAEVAKQIRAVFAEFTPVVEPLSLDEAFLDVTASLGLFRSAQHIAERLKARVREVTGLTVSIGIAPNKLVAKIASTLCKPDGLLEVPPAEVETFLHPLPVRQLWGVGPSTHRMLAALRIETIGDLATHDPEILERRLGSFGVLLWELAHGHDGRAVDARRRRQSYGEECTFAQDLRDGDALRGTIIEHAESVARHLRADGRRARTVTLKLKLAQRIGPGKYPVLTRSLTLTEPVDDGKAIGDAALSLWAAVQRGKTVRLIGVAVSGIEGGTPAQLPLFRSAQSRRRAALNQALDILVARFGRTVIGRWTVRRGRR